MKTYIFALICCMTVPLVSQAQPSSTTVTVDLNNMLGPMEINRFAVGQGGLFFGIDVRRGYRPNSRTAASGASFVCAGLLQSASCTRKISLLDLGHVCRFDSPDRCHPTPLHRLQTEDIVSEDRPESNEAEQLGSLGQAGL